MRGIKNLLIGLIGIIFIGVSLKLLLVDNSDEYVKMIGATLFGLFLIYPIFKKDTTTDVEKFIENQNIEVVIWWKRLVGFIIDYTRIDCFHTRVHAVASTGVGLKACPSSFNKLSS